MFRSDASAAGSARRGDDGGGASADASAADASAAPSASSASSASSAAASERPRAQVLDPHSVLPIKGIIAAEGLSLVCGGFLDPF